MPDADPSELPFSAGIPPDHPEAAMPAKTKKEFEEIFLQANAERRTYRRMYQSSVSNTLFEYACDEHFAIGDVCDEIGVEGIRLSRNVIDVQDEGHVSQLITQADDHKTADAWVSLPCADFTPWQHMNVHRHGWGFQQKLDKRRKQVRKMFAQAKRFMKKILAEGGRVDFEWPENSGWWNLEEVKDFEKEHAFRRVYFDGCMIGAHGKDCPIRKPWCVSSCDERILTILAAYSATRTSMNLLRIVRQSKQASTQDSSHRLSSKHGIRKSGFNMFQISALPLQL